MLVSSRPFNEVCQSLFLAIELFTPFVLQDGQEREVVYLDNKDDAPVPLPLDPCEKQACEQLKAASNSFLDAFMSLEKQGAFLLANGVANPPENHETWLHCLRVQAAFLAAKCEVFLTEGNEEWPFYKNNLLALKERISRELKELPELVSEEPDIPLTAGEIMEVYRSTEGTTEERREAVEPLIQKSQWSSFESVKARASKDKKKANADSP